MPHEAGPLVSQVLQRVRDPHAVGTTRELALKILSQSQIAVNGFGRYSIVTESLTTKANMMIYPVAASLPLSQRILTIFDSDGHELDCAKDWRNLANFRSNWFRNVGTRHNMWSLIGRDLLVVYPAKEIDSTVSVVSVHLTPALVTDDVEIEFDVANDAFLLDIAELILTIKNRNLPTAMSLLKMIQEKVKVS